jgi:hypothetical protein
MAQRQMTTTVPRYAPMIPTLVAKPFHREGWVYEEKIDGYRMLAYKDGRKVRLVSRNGADHTPRYPDVAAAIRQLPSKTLVLAGELAVFDQQLRSRFDWLRHRQPNGLATPLFLSPSICSTSAAATLRSDRASPPSAARGSPGRSRSSARCAASCAERVRRLGSGS